MIAQKLTPRQLEIKRLNDVKEDFARRRTQRLKRNSQMTKIVISMELGRYFDCEVEEPEIQLSCGIEWALKVTLEAGTIVAAFKIGNRIQFRCTVNGEGRWMQEYIYDSMDRRPWLVDLSRAVYMSEARAKDDARNAVEGI